jgi:hypothetical protein
MSSVAAAATLWPVVEAHEPHAGRIAALRGDLAHTGCG